MKFPLLAAFLLSAQIAFADEEENLRFRDLDTLQTPALSVDELKQIRFSSNFERTNMNLPGLKVELYNPFRDKSLRGIVVSIQTKSAAGQEETMQAFCDVSCGPLQSAWSYIDLFRGEELAKSSPVVKLIEVHREVRAAADNGSGDLNILRSPIFTPEEMKQLLVRLSLQEDAAPSIVVQMHNPFRDKSVRGVVLQVQYKTPDGAARTLEIFDDLECRPLNHVVRVVAFYNASEIAKASPVITLKEAHRGE